MFAQTQIQETWLKRQLSPNSRKTFEKNLYIEILSLILKKDMEEKDWKTLKTQVNLKVEINFNTLEDLKIILFKGKKEKIRRLRRL